MAESARKRAEDSWFGQDSERFSAEPPEPGPVIRAMGLALVLAFLAAFWWAIVRIVVWLLP